MTSTGAGAASGSPAIIVQQVRGLAGSTRAQRNVVRGLGLRRIGHTVTRPDNPMTRGMVARVPHLVRIVESDPSSADAGRSES